MKNLVSVNVDISSMTLEELKDARKQARNILFEIEYQTMLKKKEEAEDSSN